MINRINTLLLKYTEMDIRGVKIRCPYWMNKMKLGLVVIRGFQNGKGDFVSIQNEIIKNLEDENTPDSDISPEFLEKLPIAVKNAKRCRDHHETSAGDGNPSTQMDILVRSLNAATRAHHQFKLD